MEGRKLVIDVIDNGGQWTHREWRMLRYLGVDTKIFPNDTPLSGLREVDGLILSGGAARVGLTGELGNCAEYLTLDVPILGICAGHQFMAGYYGGKSAEAPKPEFGPLQRYHWWVQEGRFSTEPRALRQSGKATTTRSPKYRRVSRSLQGASRARSKGWRTLEGTDSAFSSIQK